VQQIPKGLDTHWKVSSPISALVCQTLISTFADSKHLGATSGADTLCRWFAILHGYGPGISHFPLGTALNAIRFHSSPPLFSVSLRHSPLNVKRRGIAQLFVLCDNRTVPDADDDGSDYS